MNQKHQPTTQELNRSIALVLMVLGKHLPASLVVRMAQELDHLADQTKSGGETNVGTLTKDFAKALATAPGEGMPKTH